tara:strand:+ start:1106 stop:3775 length:2670 start_codon:yes stop_codon:yes gene_type:complete
MPKKSIEINPFDGGLNNYADARDIKENELAVATNVDTDQPGRIKMGKRIKDVSVRTGPGNVAEGKGLFQYNSDYNTSNAGVPTEYQLLYDNNTLYRRDADSTNFTSISSLGSAYNPVYFSLDGNVRFADGDHASDTKFIGVTNVDNFSLNQAPALTIVNSYIDPPTDGDLTRDPADSTAAPSSQNDNYIDMIVKQKTGSTTDWFTFDGSDSSDKQLTNIRNRAYSSNLATAVAADVTEANINTSALIDTSHTLNGASVSASSGEYYHVDKGDSGVDFSECKITFASGQDTSFEDKSIFFDVYVPSGTKNNMQSTALIVEVGNQESDHYTYNIANSQITADQWTTLELKFGQHDSQDGSPNASGILYFKVTAKFQGNGTTNTDWGIDSLKTGDITVGTWNGRYRFFYSWIYDKTQESIPFKFNGQSTYYEVENKILQFRAHLKLSSSPGDNDRITGANVYYVEYDLDDNPLDTDKKLLLEIDVESGIKKVGAETFEAWGTAAGSNTGYEAPRNSGHTAFVQVFDPSVLETFSTRAGYEEYDKLKKMKYSTGLVMNRRAYVGNVKITDQNSKDIVYSDRIYKSEPNMIDVFTENSYVDVAINDGEKVTALANLGDMLLQYKERSMYIINCTQEIEYLEDKYEFRGVWGQAAVCTTDSGIMWVNKYGLFLYNGRQVLSLIDKKIDPQYWNDNIGTKPIIGFEPISRTILVVGSSDAADSNQQNGFVYSLVSEGFNFISGSSSGYNLFTNDMTNLVNSNDGTLSWYIDSGSDVREQKWYTAENNTYIEILTRDQDFKDPARRKMVKNVYITYKLPNGEGVPTVKFRTNGGTTDYNFDAAMSDNHSDWYTQILKPATSAQANNVYSFQVRLFGATGKGFEINDINVVYRDKVLK